MNNTSVSGNSPGCSSEVPSTLTKVALTTAYAVVFVVAILGNCAIILIVRTKRRIRKVAFNFFIISMAMADILDALIAVPMTVMAFYIRSRWFGGLIGHITCKISHFLNVLSLAASILTLTAISVERYVAIVHVLRKPLSARKVKMVIAVLWLFSAVMMTTYLYKYRVGEKSPGVWECSGSWAADLQENLAILQYEIMLRFILLYSFPLIIMIVLYSLIIAVLKKRQAFGENMSQIRIQRQNRTVVKMLVTVVVIFAVCWMPIMATSLMIGFDYDKFTCIPFSLVLFMFWPAHANSAINPCIYLIFNENFRKGLKELLTRSHKNKAKGVRVGGVHPQRYSSSALDKDACRAGLRGHFREFSRGKTSDSDEVFDTRL